MRLRPVNMAIQPAARRPQVFRELLFCSLRNTSCRTRRGNTILHLLSEGVTGLPSWQARWLRGPCRRRKHWTFLNRPEEDKSTSPTRVRAPPQPSAGGQGVHTEFVEGKGPPQITAHLLQEPLAHISSWLAWLSWLEHHPVDRKVAGLTPGQGTYPSCGFDPRLGHV